MDIRELGRLDLNLLVALEALLEERSVSRAAERLFVTQSAMSKTLGRLRELFGDPLFLRRASGMIPTPRAEQLAAALPDVLLAVEQMIQPEAFDPLEYAGEMTIVVQGHMGSWFLPALIARLQTTAPGLRLRALSRSESAFEDLAAGTLDFVLQIERHAYPPDLCLTTLAFAQPVMLVRKEHPLLGTRITLNDVLRYPQVSLLSTDIADMRFHEGDASAALEYEKRARPQFRTDDLQTAVEIVKRTDCLFPAPPMFIEQFNLSRYITRLPIPELDGVSIKYVAVRHKRVLDSPAHTFFYGEIIATTEDFRRQLGLPDLPTLRKNRGLAY